MDGAGGCSRHPACLQPLAGLLPLLPPRACLPACQPAASARGSGQRTRLATTARCCRTHLSRKAGCTNSSRLSSSSSRRAMATACRQAGRRSGHARNGKRLQVHTPCANRAGKATATAPGLGPQAPLPPHLDGAVDGRGAGGQQRHVAVVARVPRYFGRVVPRLLLARNLRDDGEGGPAAASWRAGTAGSTLPAHKGEGWGAAHAPSRRLLLAASKQLPRSGARRVCVVPAAERRRAPQPRPLRRASLPGAPAPPPRTLMKSTSEASSSWRPRPPA